ncbi:MAG: hypothetical protein ABIG20_00200 [archaeon]
MAEDISLERFAAIAFVVVVISVLGTMMLFAKGPFITGFAVGTAQLIVNNTTAISVDASTTPMDFGTMDVNTQNDTTNDDPSPFIISNDGNVMVNITVGAADMWTSDANPTANYKVNSSENESASVVSATNLTTWMNMPATGAPSNIVTHLWYETANDSIKVNINVTVPGEELPGSKSSVVTFTASQA